LAEFVTNFVTTYFICTSLPDVKTGARLLPNFCNKHTLIRSAVDWPTFSRVTTKRKPFFDKEKKYIFGTIARFQQQKNLIDLFKAFFIVHLQNSAARLEVIGDGPLRESLVSWIGNHKMEHAITLLGWQDAVVQQMKTWHVFVLCSLWEGLPHAIVQARLLKMPVISYDVGGVSDIILHQENGLLYPPGDWQGIASGMLKLSRDPTLYTKLQTHREMLDEFNDQEMIRHHGALYKKIYSKIGDF
jgi:glycosyltransferase involved in cell wall biosynthesis